MGTKLIRHQVKEESMDIPAIPPRFESLTAFSLKRVDDSKVASASTVSVSALELQPTKKELGIEESDNEKIKRPIRRRPWINYSQFNSSSGDESESEQVALKTLIVIHKTLREGDPTFREELLNFQQRRHILQLAIFKDDSSPIGYF